MKINREICFFPDIGRKKMQIVIAPESGNLLGGSIVNVTGPCFQPNDIVKCRFNAEEVNATIIDQHRAVCKQPFLKNKGNTSFELVQNHKKYNLEGIYYAGKIHS